ncbi:hypothetical protein LINPERHAP1_LOCUS34595 [Linum perenne]
MNCNESLFSSLSKTDKCKACFRDNQSSKIIGCGKIGTKEKSMLNNVFLVENVRHNLLSISQVCGNGNYVIFESDKCFVKRGCDNEINFQG